VVTKIQLIVERNECNGQLSEIGEIHSKS